MAILLAIGCASDRDRLPEPAGQKTTVRVGMTREEVLKVLGHKPKRIDMTPRGEIWHYDNTELAMIPFNFGFQPEFKDFYFDHNGVLVDYRTTQPAR